VSDSGAQVYLPRSLTAAAIARWLGERLPDAVIERSSGGLVLRLMGGELALAIDRSLDVRVEAQELAERAPAGTRGRRGAPAPRDATDRDPAPRPPDRHRRHL
jgi:hypothetical protein